VRSARTPEGGCAHRRRRGSRGDQERGDHPRHALGPVSAATSQPNTPGRSDVSPPFTLTDQAEQVDNCASVYQESLLYLRIVPNNQIGHKLGPDGTGLPPVRWMIDGFRDHCSGSWLLS